MARPWDRTPEESAQAHAAFLSYMHMGPGRSLAKVRQSTGKNLRLLERWSAAHAWVQRCGEWDAFLAHKAEEAAVSEVEAMNTKQAAVGDLMVAIVHAKAAELSQQLDRLPVQLLHQWARVGAHLARVARGAASEILAGQGDAAAQAGPTLGELFEIPAEMGELVAARMVVERSRPIGDDPDEWPDDDDDEEEELPPAAEVMVPAAAASDEGPDPEPAPLAAVADLPPDPDPEEERAKGLAWLRDHPRRPPPGPDLVTWFHYRRVVGLDPTPDDRPRPQRRRRRTVSGRR